MLQISATSALGDGVTDFASVAASANRSAYKFWTRSRCEEAAQALSEGAPAHGAAPLLVHSALLFGGEDSDPRKERLLPLSFLLAHRAHLATSRLVLWHVGAVRAPLRALLAPLLEHPTYGQSVALKEFDPSEQFGNLGFLPSAHRERMRLHWFNESGPPKSDVMRYVLLYNYGGLWLDTDMLVVRDLHPLAGHDFLYIVETVVNNAVVGTSRQGSPFMRLLLQVVNEVYGIPPEELEPEDSQNYFRFGANLFMNLVEDTDGSTEFGPLPYRLIPGCLVEPLWTDLLYLEPAGQFAAFFNGSVQENQVEWVDPSTDRSHVGSFCVHWHGRWSVPWVAGSLAAEAEAVYLRKLGLPTVVPLI